jgi:hypothetical protein
VILPDFGAKKHGLIRIIDESGEDYLYPKAFFRPVALPPSVRRRPSGVRVTATPRSADDIHEPHPRNQHGDQP